MDFFTTSQINLGPLVLNTALLYILIGFGVGSIFLILVTKADKNLRKISSDIITNFFLIVILTWKLLPLFMAPIDIISNPISIFYASGGSVGIGLGVGLGIIYLGLKMFLFWKHPVGTGRDLSLRDILKPIIVFFIVAGIVSSTLFFISGIARSRDNNDKDVRSYVSTVGNAAPNFELMDIDGQNISLNDFKGKWVILNFWATWCPPCRAELPTLNRFYEGMDKDKVVLLGINAAGTEKTDEKTDVRSYVSTFVTNEGIDFPILLDFCKNTEPCVSTIYGAGNLPTTVVISPEGIITQIKTGVVDTFWLRSVVNQ